VGDREALATLFPTISSGKNQASTLRKGMPAVEQQIYVPPITVYHSTISHDQDQASTSTNATPAMEEEQIRQILQNPALQPGASPGIVSRRGAPAAYPPNVPRSQNQAGTAVEQQGYAPPSNTLYRSTTISASEDQASTSTRARTAVGQHNYFPPNAAYLSTASSSQNQASALTRRRPAIEQQSYTARNRGLEPERRDRADFFATVLNPDNNAATPAERDKGRTRSSWASEAEQRAQAQRDTIERNGIALVARAQVRNTAWNPPAVLADANSAVVVSAGREDVERAFMIGQRARAERNATVAEQSTAARVFAARENMQRVSEGEQRVQAQAQRDAIERGRAALGAYEQARATSSHPPNSVADTNRFAAPLAAHDEEHAAAQDSLVSSPVIAHERTPLSQAMWSSVNTPATTTTAPTHQSTNDQHRPRAPRSIAQLLAISRHDAEYSELTDQEKRDRRRERSRVRSQKWRAEAKRAKRSG
jgi:hypothetical protein